MISVTLAEIARIAGVGRAAVSNWRRRYANFPPPVGGTDTSPQFALEHVEEWLRRENKLKTAVNPLDRLWPEYESLGDRDLTGALVARVGLALSGSAALAITDDLPVLDHHATELLDRSLRLAESEGGARTFDLLLDRWLRTHVRQVAVTPQPLAELMVTVAMAVSSAAPPIVQDPACGTGALLLAAGRRLRDAGHRFELWGQDDDPVLVALSAARLAMQGLTENGPGSAVLTTGDTLRAPARHGTAVDMVICNPPSNERDWGHAELATDARWVYGQPPRTEPELAWVQHAVSALAPGGVAVLVLPPAVAARRAGRRIRAALVRAGVLQALIALPPGAAPPYGVGLHIWVLRPEGAPAPADDPSPGVTLVDATHAYPAAEGGEIDWASVTQQAVNAVLGKVPQGCVSLPAVELLDDLVDLTPARHIPSSTTATLVDLRRSWGRFDRHMQSLQDAAGALSALAPSDDADPTRLITVAELEQAGALDILSGQTLPEAVVRRGQRRTGDALVLTGPPLPGGPDLWLPATVIEQGVRDGTLTVTASQDIIVSTLARSFDVWVESEAPTVLGPQLLALRVNPEVLDPWFLSGCLRAPANVRRAGTHASTTSRIDVRRLRVPRFSLEEQRRYGEIQRMLCAFERDLLGLQMAGSELGRSLGDLLAAGRMARD
ncbi:N-6 DNA methylase [Streptomyces aidingensis]|uniref:N-6 DNA Methylase n=1 Tax=Streptomyces aidingensis TaxID=910347 RepID=A0A1I1UXH2_9ACTN|nr:N-6 DNA methylase [Streptomyces aidingensis]SFD72720.1 N-6 DNA Methylase [Streptomyces aidingensis]